MPDEQQDIDKQSSDTPHFNEFSGSGDIQSTQFEPITENVPTPSVDTSPVIHQELTLQPSEGFTPFAPESANNPTENQQPQEFVPNPVPIVSPTSDSTLNPPPTEMTKSSGLLKNKKLLVSLAVAFFVVLICGGSTYAYVSYYQNPQKVIADSLINVVTAKTAIYTGKFDYEMKSEYSNINATVDITTKQSDSSTGSLNAKLTLTVDGKKIVAEGDALVDKKGDLYFKVDGVAEIVAEAKTSYGSYLDAKTNTSIDKLVQKIDNTWIRISTDDLATFSQEYSTTKKCINDATEKFKNDKIAITEVTDLYIKNPFIVIKKELGQKDGSFGYEIGYDEKSGTSFGKSLQNTKIYKELNKCDSNTFSIDDNTDSGTLPYEDQNYDSESSTKDVITYKLWVNIWSHQITNFEVNAKTSSKYSSDTQSGSFYIKPDYNRKVTIDTPTKSITLSELKTYIEELTTSMYGSYDYPTYDDTPSGNI